MSNADDRCAHEGCGERRDAVVHAFIGAEPWRTRHAFVEAPQPAPSGDADYRSPHAFVQYRYPDARGCLHQEVPSGQFCGRPSQAHQPAPGGDEAKVRDAGVTLEDNRAVVRLAEAYPDIDALPGPVLDGIAQALANHRREAYAAGKADGEREERAACEAIVMEKHCESDCLHPSCGHHRKLANRIARRGSEGK